MRNTSPCSMLRGNLFMKAFAYIDGFNLYHYLKNYIEHEYEKDKASKSSMCYIREYEKNILKWCDIPKLISLLISKEYNCVNIKYFTAFPKHRDIGQQERHIQYMEVLERYCKVTVINGRYSRKDRSFTCPEEECRKKNIIPIHEEKGTDVALGVNVISDLHIESPDLIIIVSNDTDFKPVVTNILEKSKVKVLVLFPLGCPKKKRFHYADLKKQYQGRIIQKPIMPIHMEKSIMPDMIQVDDKTYTNPYPLSS